MEIIPINKRQRKKAEENRHEEERAREENLDDTILTESLHSCNCDDPT